MNLVSDNRFPSIKMPSFLLNPFLFPDKTLSSLCQNHTSDDNEKSKTKSKIHIDIYPGSSFPLHLFITFPPFFWKGGGGLGGRGEVLFTSLLDVKKKGSTILSTYELSNIVLDQEPLLSSPSISFLFLTKL